MSETENTPDAPEKDDPVATTILEMLGQKKSLTFKDVAMAIADAKRKPKDRPDLWRRYINAVKQQSVHLARQKRIEIVRKGEVADPDDFKGIVRIRLAGK